VCFHCPSHVCACASTSLSAATSTTMDAMTRRRKRGPGYRYHRRLAMGLWQRLSTIGSKPDETPGERRRLSLTNQSAVIGTVSCGSFAIGYAIAGSRYLAPMIANLVAVALLLFALFLSSRGARTAAKLFVLAPVNLVVVVASMLLGGRVGFLYYFFLF